MSKDPDQPHQRFRIFGLGTIVVDHQVYLESFPAADTKGEIIEDRWQVGGPVPTALCVLARFGMETVFQGKWGSDTFGETIESDLNAEGIRFDRTVCRSGSRTGFAHVWVERATGRRTIAGYRGSHPVELSEVRFPDVESCDALHLDGWSWEAASAAASAMKRRDGLVSMDLGSPKPQLEQMLKHVDVLSGPESMVYRVFGLDDLGEGAKRFLELGPREVVFTRGSEGAIYFSGVERLEQPGFQVEAVDTNGAGDVFSGAFLYGTLRKWRPDQKLKFACATAALKCAQQGNREAIPSMHQVESFLS